MRLPVSIACIVYRRAAHGLEFALLHRAPERIAFWQPITGGMETTDASLLSCMWRELREEGGLGPADVVQVFQDFFVREFPGRHPDYGGEKTVTEHWFAVEIRPESEIALSREHDDLRWLPFDDAVAMLTWDGNKDGFLRLSALLSSAPKPKPL